MNPNVYVCYFVWLILAAVHCDYSLYHSSSFSSSSSSGHTKDSTKIARENGREVRYCAYKNMKYLPGSNFVDYDECVKCECTEEWLTCTNMEAKLQFSKHSSGSEIKTQTNCVRLQIGCETKWVLKKDYSSDCPIVKTPETH